VRALEIILALVTFAVVVAILADRLRAPAPSLLVVAGLAVGLIPGVSTVEVPPELVSLVVLPPLLYAAATDVSMREFRVVVRPVLILAIGLVALSALAVAVTVTVLAPQMTFTVGLVLGAVLASTDPVAVSALARRLRLPPRLLALVQGESLLNDATSLVLFSVAVGIVVAGTPVTALGVLGQFVWLGGAGALVGLFFGWVVERLRRRTNDAVLHTVLALLTPYVVYVGAELLHTSGVTAVVLCGLSLSRRGDLDLRGPVRLQTAQMYTVIIFILESMVFALIGLELPTLLRNLTPADQGFLWVALALTVVLILTRVLWIFPTGYLRRFSGIGERVTESVSPWRSLLVLSWAGTRGVVPLAAALSIPLVTDDGSPFPNRDLILVLAVSCIILTLLVQGLTLAPLVKRLKVRTDMAQLDEEKSLALQATTTAALASIDDLADEDIPESVVTRVRREIEARVQRLHPSVDDDSADELTSGDAYRRLRLAILVVEAEQLASLHEDGRIGESVRREVQRSLDLEEAALRGGSR